uniref:Membrane-associated kinase regulator 6 n=1 Tax=Leersia perrieri TaxID=77586 RepID=A0A0D9VNW6_9ORYZ
MEVGSLQHLGDSFSSYRWLKHASGKTPSFKRLVDVDGDVGGGGSSRYFIDMDPADLFSMRWTAPDGSDLNFDFDLPAGVGDGDDDDSTIFPLLVSASKIFHDGRLLPHEMMITDDDGDVRRRVSGSTSPVFHSAQSTPASLSSSSSARSKQNAAATPTPLLAAGKSSSSSSPWKILLRYLRFLMPLYRKVRALPTTATRKRRVSPAASSAAVSARASTSSIDWCHGIADTAVHDAILYCKKSSILKASY